MTFLQCSYVDKSVIEKKEARFRWSNMLVNPDCSASLGGAMISLTWLSLYAPNSHKGIASFKDNRCVVTANLADFGLFWQG
jgi:hypothetical protein